MYQAVEKMLARFLLEETMSDDSELDAINEKNIARFISEKATLNIGPGCVIGSSLIVFEFIRSDGRLGHGVLRQRGSSMQDAIELLMGATDTILDAEEGKFPYGQADPDDI